MLEVLLDENFLGAFLLTLSMMGAGFLLRRTGTISSEGKRALTSLVWKLALPCLAFTTFMQDFSVGEMRAGGIVLAASFVLYAGWILLLRLCFARMGSTRATVGALMGTIGQLTLFTMPLLSSVGSTGALMDCGIMTLSFRVFLYFVAYPMIFRGQGTFRQSVRKVLLSPVMIFMFLGMGIWLLQGMLPAVNGVCVFRIDRTLPAVYRVFSTLSAMVSPLAMLLIGMNIGESHLTDTFRDISAWGVALVRVAVVPLCVFGITALLPAWFDADARMALTLGFSAPASVTIGVFCAESGVEEKFSSHIAVISSLLCALSVPLCYALASV